MIRSHDAIMLPLSVGNQGGGNLNRQDAQGAKKHQKTWRLWRLCGEFSTQ